MAWYEENKLIIRYACGKKNYTKTGLGVIKPLSADA
jgi:hypothetical protein